MQQTRREHALLGSDEQTEEQSGESNGVDENGRWITIKALLLLLLGTIIAAAFADPLVDAVDNFSDATSIPTFFISFIALPLATNSSESVSAIIFASRKKVKTASLTFSEVFFCFCHSCFHARFLDDLFYLLDLKTSLFGLKKEH